MLPEARIDKIYDRLAQIGNAIHQSPATMAFRSLVRLRTFSVSFVNSVVETSQASG